MTGSLILVFGFLPDIKHAIEPDYVIAVSATARESKDLKKMIPAKNSRLMAATGVMVLHKINPSKEGEIYFTKHSISIL